MFHTPVLCKVLKDWKNKGKVVPVPLMTAYVGVEVQLHAYLISARNGEKWITSWNCRFILEERAPSIIEQEAEWAQELVWILWWKSTYDLLFSSP